VRRTAACAVLAAGLACVAAAPAHARPRAQLLDAARLGSRPVQIRDRVLAAGKPAAHAAATPAGYDRWYSAPDGSRVRVVISTAFQPDPAVGQSWTDFLGGLVHGSEISDVLVYVQSDRQVAASCGSAGVYACYDARNKRLNVPGHTPSDGTPLEEVAAHEYGHHVARDRRNDPWLAIAWGTKRWATYENVCPRVLRGTAFPGDQGAHYRQDPGEAFADSYRILNGGRPSLWEFDQSFFPGQRALAQIRADVRTPWTRPMLLHSSGRLHAGSRPQLFRLHTPLDGALRVTMRAPRRSDFDVYLTTAPGRLVVDSSTGGARTKRLRDLVCGGRNFYVGVVRRRGAGRFRVEVSRP
jgi:hypothetical protein